ncbi:DeoR/GlpR family DNA-binding transcription regulator [Labrys wisconsinensis]|uniref:DeoR/GlpR family transcriptional regulator of sugar metabolism n=1 Tax=Labrys wisconsinensis TaxID=425677 RepID=A0ABU0JEF7_9HYPH|nr:DeoR/GlpR family DNA-binding transcription regulator [Labrys wisconsinensis]MDQ0472658.1 DeoR/GlpR family transcriptional regulator of sugar metabolism [Labrys wisconsinensis]
MAGRNGGSAAGRGGPVIGAERQRVILELINRGEIVSVGDFADRFGVSQETIRRDIRSLEDAGRLRRVHGGAAPKRTFDLTARRPVVERLAVDREAKQRAARAALALFEDEMSVYLGASSTMLMVAEELARSERTLTITTNMIDIAMVTAASGRCAVTLLGGVVNPQTRTVGGFELLKSLEHRLFDLYVFGASAVSATHGVLGPTMGHNVLVRTLCDRSHRIAVVADSAKFGRRDAHVVLPLDAIDVLATDAPPPRDLAAALDRANVTVLLPRQSENSTADGTDSESTASR